MRSQLVLKFIVLVVLFAVTVITSGCSNLQSLINAQNTPPSSASSEAPIHSSVSAKFSDNPNMIPPTARQYRRMTKSQMEDESELHSQAGSMWNSEGQGAYLFTQNKTRREGDLLNVKLEGPGQKQVETKVGVIKKLLKQLEDQEAEKNATIESGGLASNQDPKTTQDGRAPASSAASAPVKVEKEEKDEPVDIGPIPARIVERSPDGNYRVKGAQPFMIGKREYKVILTGIIRPEDFNDEGVGSNKVIDPQYDVVSLRRAQ